MSSFRPSANVDGNITPLEEGRLPVLDRGFLYGDSVYEVFRTYDGVPLFWREHMDRLENSARMIHMPLSQSTEELMDQIRRTVAHARDDSDEEVYVRFHVSRGVGPVDLYPDPKLTTSFMIMVKQVPAWKQEHYDVGLRLAVTRVRRNSNNSLSPNIKSGNYLNNILGLAEAVEHGADDCLMLNAEGNATESSNSNVFLVIDGKLVTPHLESGILKGITGSALQRAAGNIGVAITEGAVPEAELQRVEEAFVTSATREVMPVGAIRLASGDWRELPPGGGEFTRRMADGYRNIVADYTAANTDARLW